MSRQNLLSLTVLAILMSACGSTGEVGGGPTPTSTPGPTSPPAPGGTGGTGCTLPGRVTNLAVATNDTRATLTWSAVNTAVDYYVLIGTSPGSSNRIDTNTTQTSYNWAGGGVGTFYARIAAHNACGTGPSSTEVAFTLTSLN